MGQKVVELKPNPGQQEFALRVPYSIREVLYGGARGGGKTYAGLIWLTEYVDHPRFQGLVIRRNADDLSDWVERARYMYKDIGGIVSGNPPVFRFPSGAFIRTGHLKDDSTYTKYQGHEYQKILIEELTQIASKERYQKLISSCRTSIPELKPQVFSTTNPGGIGHLWVKEMFIDPGPPNKSFLAEDGIKRIYIPATMMDNPQLMENDPEYVSQIEALKFTDEALYRAWRFGDWDIFVGQVFREWRVTKHVIPYLPYGIELEQCKLYMSFDWGYNDAASLHWLAVAPENDRGVRHIYVYREIYKTEEHPDWWAQQIAEIVRNEPVQGLILPHDAYSVRPGSLPIEQQFRQYFDRVHVRVPIYNAEAQSHKARMNRIALMHNVLAESWDGTPTLQVLENCRNFIRTLPALPYSENKPEDIDDASEDHAFDSVTYGLYKLHSSGMATVVNPKLAQQMVKIGYLTEGGKIKGNIDIASALKGSMVVESDWRYK
jgi:phage terminase large subunit